MATKTLIGFQNSLDSKITTLQLCSDPGELSTTGKVLNNLYASTALVKKLIEEGTQEQIDVSSVVGIDNYMWGVVGTDFGRLAYHTHNSSLEFLKSHSTIWKYLYMFSEADNKWYVSSNDNQTWRLLDNEL